MRTWRVALATTAVGLLSATACTGGQSGQSGDSPDPLPTTYSGDPPPGSAGSPSRFLHGRGADGPDILDDAGGVRITSLGNAFLISSNSGEQHLLQRPEGGEVLWEGDQRIERIGSDRDGSEVLVLRSGSGDSATTTVVDDTGETVWRGSGPRERYLDGVVVRYPPEWSPDGPYGEFTVLDTGGNELWDFTFEEPPDSADSGDDDEDGTSEDGQEGKDEQDGQDEDDGTNRAGVPVGARQDTLLLDDGSGGLQARQLPRDGEEAGGTLWSVSGNASEIAGNVASPTPTPHLVDFYELPAQSGEPASGEGGTATDTAALFRWGFSQEPSVLTMHDLRSGELLWRLTEPGVNPAGREFDPDPVSGSVYDSTTRTLLLPQGSGQAPVAAVDLVTGAIRWEFDDADERAISPAFAWNGRIFGDTRGAGSDSSSQVVLEARTKETETGALDAYVETATEDGHILAVQNRQRFVFAPEEGAGRESPGSRE
ncbi:hypothetical protein FHX37_4224 [Haloactinospora alba]|uniref:Pyrroloquinoline-quinone binding quinoprotein n=1 Tax=Haloactinospora alba TaxID=405555 RepID=A0A543N6P4_9ACTN|nr:hypothetical protein [Haloactinospora alba]TQN27503.1 hypothetical protein FHX37_4224 [Haloactinospora alba]